MGNRKRIIHGLKDQIALCGSDPETERTWVTFTTNDARRILKMPWEDAFDAIHNEYNRIGDEMFDDNGGVAVDVVSGKAYVRENKET